MARALLTDLRRIDRALLLSRTRCATGCWPAAPPSPAAAASATCWRPRSGGHVGDVSRFGSSDRFASYTATAPIEVSSGEVTRHCLSRSRNRSLTNALHLAARVQTMHPGAGRDHYERKLAEHKSSREALRSLKRQLPKVVYRHLVADRLHLLALAV
jgi:hypothetical protein